MLSKPKTSMKEYSNKMAEIILTLCKADKLYTQIANQVKIL